MKKQRQRRLRRVGTFLNGPSPASFYDRSNSIAMPGADHAISFDYFQLVLLCSDLSSSTILKTSIITERWI